MVREIFIIEEGGFRKEAIDGAIILSMGIIQKETGGLIAFLEPDDGKGMATYNILLDDKPIGKPAEESGKRIMSDFFDFVKINKALGKLGYQCGWNLETNEWFTEPTIVGKKAWINSVKTGTSKPAEGKETKEYFSLVDVVKIEDGSTPVAKQGTHAKPGAKPTIPPAAVKGALTDELLAKWKEVVGSILSEPLNESGITAAIKAAYPNDTALRTALAGVRPKALKTMLDDGTLILDEDAKYSLAV